MKIAIRYLLLLLSLAIAQKSFAGGCEPRCAQDRSLVVSADGLRFSGIAYKQKRLNGLFVAVFSSSAGLRVTDSVGKPALQLSSRQFVAALEAVITDVRRHGGRLDQVQLEMDTVSDVWDDIRKAVRAEARRGQGKLHSKDAATSKALLEAIKRSELVRQTCAMVQRHAMKCHPYNSFTEQIAFQQKYSSGDRSQIVKADDVGIVAGLGISIRFIDASSPPKR
ncbi:hypothetical protein [Lysobacter arvi]|uniref:DUF2884 family protein n=1 Tax=Lysobacter arvi TaxID=3038776 RepID=A0ABU1C8C8_9GAMM|nr:hypothetical protein [Lysobacter arvi]MDR0181437.1 hypothetical protein [Lysobacter arvi]